jgi:3-hydroxyisobutyrate dehydrogenase
VETIGFIGLGNMGAPMASPLLATGYPLVVHDARASAGESFRARGARWVAWLIEEWAGIELRSKPGDPA